MLERLGQQSGLATKLFVNVTPCATSERLTVRIAQSVSQRWSSVRTRTMLGGLAARAAAVGVPSPAPSHAARRASASASTPTRYLPRRSIAPSARRARSALSSYDVRERASVLAQLGQSPGAARSSAGA